MASRLLLLRAYLRSAVNQAAKCGKTPTQLLEDVQLGKFNVEATDGRTILSTTEAGGTVTFAFPGELTPGDVLEYTEEALEWLSEQTNPDAPVLDWKRPARRLRMTFDMGAIS